MSAIIAFLCLLLIAAGHLGRFDARWDAINFALPYVVALGSMAALLGWRSGRRRALALVAAILAASAPLLIGELPPRARADCGGSGLRLVQYNAFKDNDRPAIAARWLVAAQPDVIVLEEAVRLAPLLAVAYPYRQDCAGGGRCSTVILSRIPPRASGGAAQGDPENRGALSAAWMRLPAPDGGDMTIIGVHLGRPWPFRGFAGERDELRALVASLGRNDTIVAGDFNLPGWTYQMRQLEADLGLDRATHGLRTWPVRIHDRRWPVPLLNIDHVLTGSAWHAQAISIGPAVGSDHRPVVIDVAPCDPLKAAAAGISHAIVPTGRSASI